MYFKKQLIPYWYRLICILTLIILMLISSLTAKPQPAIAGTQIPQYVKLETEFAPIQLLLNPEEPSFRVPAEKDILDRINSSQQQAVAAKIIIDYVPAGKENIGGDLCGQWPAGSQAAFNYAALLWEAELDLPVPIKINACWANLGPGVLGYSGITSFYSYQNGKFLQPVSLANTWAEEDLNDDDGYDDDGDGQDADAEMYIAYSSNGIPWYFGTDGKTPEDKVDFLSVVMHEICHGLGFSGQMTVQGGLGGWGNGSPSAIPASYDLFAINGAMKSLLSFPNASSQLAAQLTSNNLYLAGENAIAANGGTPPKIYAPSTWKPGSSYSHLDEIFNGTVNSLMTYSVGTGPSSHNPGPITRGILLDIGWPTIGGPSVTPTATSTTPKSTSTPPSATITASPTATIAPKTPSPSTIKHIFLPLVIR